MLAGKKFCGLAQVFWFSLVCCHQVTRLDIAPLVLGFVCFFKSDFHSSLSFRSFKLKKLEHYFTLLVHLHTIFQIIIQNNMTAWKVWLKISRIKQLSKLSFFSPIILLFSLDTLDSVNYCGVSITGDIQESSGCNLVPCAIGWFCLSREVAPDHSLWSLPTSPILWFHDWK